MDKSKSKNNRVVILLVMFASLFIVTSCSSASKNASNFENRKPFKFTVSIPEKITGKMAFLLPNEYEVPIQINGKLC